MSNDEKYEKYQLSAERFTYELYDADWRYRFDNYSWDYHLTSKDIAKVFVGWCDASRLLVRPRCGEYAIMCEIDGEKFWFHHLSPMLESILEEVEKQNNQQQTGEVK